MKMSVTDAFISYLFEKAGKINDNILKKADECVQDYLAVTEAGAKKNYNKWRHFLMHTHEGKATLIGYQEKVDSKTAALVNGFNAHSLELDDGQRFAMIHLGASVISAILAAEADVKIADADKLKGIVMGYEAACRIALAMQPFHKQKGYHAAGTCGTIGAAVAIAFAFGMNKQQMKQVVTAAAGSAAGMLEMQEQCSELKPYNLGRAAMDGLTAAYIGYSAFRTPEDILGGERGFFKIFADQFDPDKLTNHQGYFEIERIYVKPYASCRHSHSAVEAAITLHKEIEVDQIKEVLVETYSLGVKGHDHTDIKGIASAKLSTPYAVAAALLFGRADITCFEPVSSEAVNLAKTVKVVTKDELTAQCPAKRVAVVTVTLLNGEKKSCCIEYAKGEPENPLTDEEKEEKRKILLSYSADFK